MLDCLHMNLVDLSLFQHWNKMKWWGLVSGERCLLKVYCFWGSCVVDKLIELFRNLFVTSLNVPFRMLFATHIQHDSHMFKKWRNQFKGCAPVIVWQSFHFRMAEDDPYRGNRFGEIFIFLFWSSRGIISTGTAVKLIIENGRIICHSQYPSIQQQFS